MTRREDWPERLMAEVERHSALPFAWGESDCFTLPMDCVLAMTGADPCASLRGYKTERGAAGRLVRGGYSSVADIFAAHFEEIPPSLAGRGDIGVVDSPRGIAGVVFGAPVILGKAEHGTRPVPRSAVLRAFRV